MGPSLLRTVLLITALAAWVAGCNGVTVVGSGNTSDSAVTDLGGDASTMDVTCAAGQIVCGGACVATSNSVEHCGGCGRTCRGGDICQNGAACRCARPPTPSAATPTPGSPARTS
jgi:hypothetical protein